MRSTVVVAGALTLALPACATPAERIADTLSSYGLERSRAECIGGHLQADLSAAQLLEFSRAAQAYRARDANPARLTVGDLLRVSSEITDPDIPLTVARSAGRCGLVPAGFGGMVSALLR